MENLAIEKKGENVFLRFSGEITLDKAAAMKKDVENATGTMQFDALVADLSKVSFIDSSGIGFLVALKTKTTSQGKEMAILAPTEEIKKTFELVQLLDFFNVIESEDELL